MTDTNRPNANTTCTYSQKCPKFEYQFCSMMSYMSSCTQLNAYLAKEGVRSEPVVFQHFGEITLEDIARIGISKNRLAV